MKKLLFLALIISVGFNLYLVDSSVEVVNDFDEKPIQKRPKNELVKDKVRLAQSSLSKSYIHNKSKCECPSVGKVDSKSKTDIGPRYDEEVVSKKLKELKIKWTKNSQDFFYNELRLRDDQIERYNELVKMRELEADEYFEPKLKNIQQVADKEDGGLPYYIHTTEDTVFMGKLAERYDSLLRQSFGDQAFSDYKKFINDYNKEIVNEEVFFPIEF